MFIRVRINYVMVCCAGNYFIIILTPDIPIVKKFIMKRTLLHLLSIALMPIALFSQQLENPGFEFWENAIADIEEPVDWNSIKTADDPSIADVAPITFERVTDAFSGEYALKLYNVNAFGITATGAICNGRFHAEFNLDNSFSYTDSTDARWHTPFTWRPDSLTGWFKYFPQEDDICQFKIILHEKECKLPENGTMDNWIGMAVYQSAPGVTYENWTRFSVPFEYFNGKNPRFTLCVINSGDSTEATVGSYLILDDLELIYNNAGIGDHETAVNFIHLEDRKIWVDLDAGKDFLGKPFRIVGLNGQTVYSKELSSPVITDIPGHLPSGIYLAVLDTGKKRYIQKFFLGR
jgi:hypothetical protein